MKTLAGAVGVTLGLILGLSALFGLGWVVQGNNFFMYKFFAPKFEAVRRDTVIESQAYSEATLRRLYDLKRQYAFAKNDEQKEAIRAIARHEADAFDRRRLPFDLQNFVDSMN